MKMNKLVVFSANKYPVLKGQWVKKAQVIYKSFKQCGYTVKKVKNFKCEGLEDLEIYNQKTETPHIFLHTHALRSEINDNLYPEGLNHWFYKSSGPTIDHFAIDTYGYGPCLSTAYKKPSFEDLVVPKEFNDKVEKWKEENITKFTTEIISKRCFNVPYNDYHLIIGQVFTDTVVTKMDFGKYEWKLYSITKKLLECSNKPIIIKIHPRQSVNNDTIKILKRLSPRILIVSGGYSAHPYIKNCRDVFLANSGAGLEVMMYDKPIISWGRPEYHWITYDLRMLSDMKYALNLDWFNKDLQRKYLYWFCERFCVTDVENTSKRIQELDNENF